MVAIPGYDGQQNRKPRAEMTQEEKALDNAMVKARKKLAKQMGGTGSPANQGGGAKNQTGQGSGAGAIVGDVGELDIQIHQASRKPRAEMTPEERAYDNAMVKARKKLNKQTGGTGGTVSLGGGGAPKKKAKSSGKGGGGGSGGNQPQISPEMAQMMQMLQMMTGISMPMPSAPASGGTKKAGGAKQGAGGGAGGEGSTGKKSRAEMTPEERAADNREVKLRKKMAKQG